MNVFVSLLSHLRARIDNLDYVYLTMETKTYTLSNKDWEPLKQLIPDKDDIIIFQLPQVSSKVNEYAVVSLTDKIEKTLEDYGCIQVLKDNKLLGKLQTYEGDAIYGEKKNINGLC